MLRAQAFENLFTLVPILLIAVISIFLRARAARRRKQREDASRGAPARGVPAQAAEGTQPTAASRTAGAGTAPRSASTPGAPARGTPARAPGPARAARFPWQREIQQYPEAEQPTPASEAPFAPQQPHRPQVAAREGYAYPPPLSLNDLKSQTTAAMQPRGTPVPRAVVGPAARSRMAVLTDGTRRGLPDGTRLVPDGISRVGVVQEAQNLRERMEARAKSNRPAVKAADGERSSITARLERLPPLKRAVIWAEILGPPGGRQQSGSR